MELLVSALQIILLLMIVGLVYFAPMLVALNNHRKQTAAIIIVNVFLGWTFLGWVVALAWACIDNKK